MIAYPGVGVLRVPVRVLLWFLILAAFLLALGARPARAVTDADVSKAMDKARQYLLAQQLPSGLWPEQKWAGPDAECGTSETVFSTLAYVGEHPNRDCMAKAMDAVMGRKLDSTYAISMRAMACSRLRVMLVGERRRQIQEALSADALWLVQAQGAQGGWDYKSLDVGSGRCDLSNAQMALQALNAAATYSDIEVPRTVWARARALYFRDQRPDGGWNYGDSGDTVLGGQAPSYGSMTAAGVASVLTASDYLDRGRECPCRGGEAAKDRDEVVRRIDAALGWLAREFRADANPKASAPADAHRLYWLRAAGRAGTAAGRLRFGEHDWYREGAEWLVAHQQADGSWGSLPETCFGLLFLYDGREPALFTKLRFRGDWNSHPRDMSRLVAYINVAWCARRFTWQTSDLGSPLAELQQAPVLYVNFQTPPTFAEEERRTLRAFTDGGGTVLIAASGQEAPARQWVADLAARVWPEWPLRPLGPDHPVWSNTYRLKSPPPLLGIDDGLRTFLFYCPGDVPCVWQRREFSSQGDLFKWPIDLLHYATDHAPWRPRLAVGLDEPEHYATPVTPGDRRSLKLVRLKCGGDGWRLGRHYRGLDRVAATVRERAGVALEVNDGGIPPADLNDADVAYLAASADMVLAEPERAAVRAYLARGGFLWVEAVGGSEDADKAVRNLAHDGGWQITPLAKDHAVLTGRFPKTAAYDLTQDVEFTSSLRIKRIGQRFAELSGVYQDDRLVGIYSPYDVVFSSTGCHACGARAYKPADARAVATNIIVFLTDLPRPR